MRNLVFRIVLAAALLLTGVALPAQDSAEQISRREALEKEIAQLEQQLKENSAKSSNALATLALVRKQVASRKALVAESEKEIRLLNDSISTVRRNANALQARLDTMMLYYGKLVRSAYKNRDSRVWYMYILGSGSIGQAARRYGYFRNLSGQMSGQVEKMNSTKSELAAELARLQTLRANAEALRVRREADLKSLKAEETKSNNVVSELTRYRTRYQQSLNSKRKQVEALNKEIERLIAQEMAAASKPGTARTEAAKQVDIRLSTEFAQNKGKLPWPADGPVVDQFGQHRHPVYTSIVMPFNNGVGIGLAKGSKVTAVFDGEVKRIIVMPGYNKCVLVQHGDYFTFYCKLGQVSVKAGDKVTVGQVLGVVDTIDGQTQLHFQVWEGKTPQDPELWLRKK